MSDSIRERYQNNTEFHRLVSLFQHVLREAQFPPSEIREALLLAMVINEAENPLPSMFRLRDFAEQLIYDQSQGYRPRPHP